MRIEAYAHKYIVQEFIGNRTCKSVDTLDEAVSFFMDMVLLSKKSCLFLEEHHLQDFGILCPTLEDISIIMRKLRNKIGSYNYKQFSRVPKDIVDFINYFENTVESKYAKIYPDLSFTNKEYLFLKGGLSTEQIKYFVENVKNVASIKKFSVFIDDYCECINEIPETITDIMKGRLDTNLVPVGFYIHFDLIDNNAV